MRRSRIGILAATLVGLAGCGESKTELVTVTGTINLNGKPLPDAEVSFVPAPGEKGLESATDTTGPQGNYKLKTGDAFGIKPGKYNVHVRKSGAATAESSRLHPDDPFMAKLSAAQPRLPGAKAKNDRKEQDAIDEVIRDREIGRDGGVVDLDIKAKTQS